MEINLKGMTTETRNKNTMDLDRMTPLEIVTVMNREDENVPRAISQVLPAIAECVEWAALRRKQGYGWSRRRVTSGRPSSKESNTPRFSLK